MKVSLVVTTGSHEGRSIPLTGPQFLIGRDPQCQLRPASQAISKLHCAILVRDGKVYLKDFGSTNGTLVNDALVQDTEVELADGAWAAVHLGVRPQGQTPLFHGLGRETFVVGIDWVDGWPVVVEDRYRPGPADHSFVDRFEGEQLDQRWLGAGSFPASFTTLLRPGLQVAADHPGPGKSLVACRVRDQQWSATATIETAGGVAQFQVRMDDRHWYGFEIGPARTDAVLQIGPARRTVAAIDRPADTPATVVITALPGTTNSLGADEPDLIELSIVHPDGSVQVIGAFEGRYLSTEVAGGFLGRMVGVEALDGRPVVRSVDYQARTGF